MKGSVMLIRSTFSVYLFCFLVGLSEEAPSRLDEVLLVISYDGFRPEYLHRHVTPTLNEFREESTWAQFMQPVFPTKTFVNHFSIATGLYAEKHGVMANGLYDQDQGFLGYSYELFHYDENTIPIWTANELSGKHSGCWWPGSDFEYNGVNCTFSMKFNESVSFEERIDTVMTWLTHETTPANLVMLYIEEPDHHAHLYGPESVQITQIAEKVDNLTRYIQNKLIDKQLENRVNIIYLSDHGMNGVILRNAINLTNFVDEGSCVMYGSSPILQIVPTQPSKEDEIYVNLTKAAQQNGHFKVYNKYNLPSRWHANNTQRLGPIIAVADSGFAFQDLWEEAKTRKEKYNISITNESVYGCHGYDNEDPSMNAIFMAKGPIFPKGKVLESINIIDLYNLFCLILNIECRTTDGTTEFDIWD